MNAEIRPEILRCQKHGCNITFRSVRGLATDTVTQMIAAEHESAQHIGIASLANLKLDKGKKPEPGDGKLYHVVSLTQNGPGKLTTQPVSHALAEVEAASRIGDKVPEYFSRGYNQDG